MFPCDFKLFLLLTLSIAKISCVCAADEAKSSNQDDPEEAGSLQIVTQSKEEVVAVYVLNDGSGVHITSTASNNGTCINITSLEGNEIILARHSDIASASLLRIMGHAIAILCKTSPDGDDDGKEHKWMDFTLPFDVSHYFDTAISQHEFPEELSHHLDKDSVNGTKHLAFDALSSSTVHMLADACQALGKSGIFGFDNPAALNLYRFILRYEIEYKSNPESFDPATLENTKPGVCDTLRPSYDKANFLEKRLYYNCGDSCPIGPECLGMCGPSCGPCWAFVCGDCCYHHGCYQHDLCCKKLSFHNRHCYFPLGLSCSEYNCEEYEP